MLARRGFRLAALIAAAVCVLALAAGAFVLSYPGARDTALAAGVSAQLARLYPGVFDAVFVVACAAAVTLRGALRGYAWVVIVVIAGSVAAADAVHAMSVSLPKRPLEATVAIVPWVVLLVGLTLLYAMARQALPGRKAAAAGQATANGAAPAAAERRHGPDERPAARTSVPLSTLLADPADPAGKPGSTADRTTPAGETAPAGEAEQAAEAAPATEAAPAAQVAEAAPAVQVTSGGAAETAPQPLPRRTPERDDPSDADAGLAGPSVLRSGAPPAPPRSLPGPHPGRSGPGRPSWSRTG